MRCIRAIAVIGAGCAASLTSAGSAQAQITINESLTTLPIPGFTTVTLPPAAGAMPFVNGGATVTFDGTAPDQRIVYGTAAGLHADPVVGPSGDGYAGSYLSTGASGYINISFANPQMSLALLWGSVDLSNQITFLNNGIVVGTVTGANIDASANGYQGYGGSYYVLMNANTAFNEVELSSGIASFEAAELEVNPVEFDVPEPASAAMLCAGLLGLITLRRRAR